MPRFRRSARSPLVVGPSVSASNTHTTLTEFATAWTASSAGFVVSDGTSGTRTDIPPNCWPGRTCPGRTSLVTPGRNARSGHARTSTCREDVRGAEQYHMPRRCARGRTVPVTGQIRWVRRHHRRIRLWSDRPSPFSRSVRGCNTGPRRTLQWKRTARRSPVSGLPTCLPRRVSRDRRAGRWQYRPTNRPRGATAAPTLA